MKRNFLIVSLISLIIIGSILYFIFFNNTAPENIVLKSCTLQECGPASSIPNWKCPDGKNYGGPACLKVNGSCAWKVLSCSNGLLEICPDVWYRNLMPGLEFSEEEQYFVINGTRREMSDFNVNWIIYNCNISSPTPVY